MTRPTIPDVLPRFRAYHERHFAWGALHIVLDDDNCDNASVEHCVKWAQESGDAEGEALARILMSMSKTQRKKLGRIA